MADADVNVQIISRKEAKRAAQTFYFTGKPCKHGHIAPRSTVNGLCWECARQKSEKRRAANPERVNAIGRKSYFRHRDKRIAINKRWVEDNRDRNRERKRRYNKSNPEKVKSWGLHTRLSAAHKERRKARSKAWYEANKERHRANGKEYYRAHPERLKLTRRKWKIANKSTLREKQKQYRLNNPAVIRQQNREWKAKNKDKVATHARNRRAQKRGSGGAHTASDILAILKLQRNRCAYCRIRLSGKHHVDHIVALINGGSNERRNLQILCEPCNLKKGRRDPIDHARQLGMLI